MRYSVSNGTLQISVDSLGAELASVKLADVERLWQNGNGSWSGHAPILFPICGNCAVIVDGVRYAMPPHGFARSTEFELVARGADFLRFAFGASAGTRKLYPFDFVFFVEYRIVGSRLDIVYEISSRDGSPVLFACGGHESFAVGDLSACKLVFAEPTRLIHRKHDANGRLTGERADFGTLTQFDRLAEYLVGGDTLIFGDVGAREVQLFECGEKRAKITFDGFDNLLLWRPHGADMVCIEPWTVLPDDAAAVPIELSHKRGILTARADRPVRLARSIEYFW